MAKSTQYTALKFFRQAVSQIAGFSQNSKIYAQRFDLINAVQLAVQGQFADLIAEAYMTDTTPVLSTTGKYYSPDTATWTASTSRLLATMDTAWATTDVGNLVVFRDGTSVYVGQIIERISGTVVKLRGDNLPAANIAAVDDVIMASTGVDGSSAIDISSLKMMRYTNQVKMRLESTATKYVKALDPDAYRKFQPTAKSDLDKIVWMLQGDKLLIKMGTSITNAGTLTLWYPRLVEDRTLDADYMDLIDGAMIQIGIIALRTKIMRMMDKEVSPSDIAEMQEKIAMLYASANGNIKKEEIKSKVEALV